ncbi:MAG: hypothetical protein CMD83_17895 [Gammaproteobacteria bacterium]|nr:hypothetical protein [Gammaproteobacteria bacterium]
MRAADFLSHDMVNEIMSKMHPDSDSIECTMLQQVNGVNSFKSGSKEINPFILAEVTNPNGFSSLQHGSIVLVPRNSCHFLPSKVGQAGHWFRFFIAEKHVKGIAHNNGQWNITEASRFGTG